VSLSQLLGVALFGVQLIAGQAPVPYLLKPQIESRSRCFFEGDLDSYWESVGLTLTFVNNGNSPISFFEGGVSLARLYRTRQDLLADRAVDDIHLNVLLDALPEGSRYVVRAGGVKATNEQIAIRVARGASTASNVSPGKYLLQVISYRRRLATAYEVLKDGRTRSWAELVSEPIELTIESEPALRRCGEA
jgi:hypothetical protein